jgi:hypothetical protein
VHPIREITPQNPHLAPGTPVAPCHAGAWIADIVVYHDRGLSAATRARVRRAIAAYAQQHPNASDTVEGILGWWIPPEASAARIDVEESLDALVVEGVLTATRLPDGTLLYAVKPPRPNQDS